MEYLILFKSTYICVQFFILLLFWRYNQTSAGMNYEQHKDTVNVYFILVGTFLWGGRS